MSSELYNRSFRVDIYACSISESTLYHSILGSLVSICFKPFFYSFLSLLMFLSQTIGQIYIHITRPFNLDMCFLVFFFLSRLLPLHPCSSPLTAFTLNLAAFLIQFSRLPRPLVCHLRLHSLYSNYLSL